MKLHTSTLTHHTSDRPPTSYAKRKRGRHLGQYNRLMSEANELCAVAASVNPNRGDLRASSYLEEAADLILKAAHHGQLGGVIQLTEPLLPCYASNQLPGDHHLAPGTRYLDLRESLEECPDCDGTGHTHYTACCGVRLANWPADPNKEVVCPRCHISTSLVPCETCDGHGDLGTAAEHDELMRDQALEDRADADREDAL